MQLPLKLTNFKVYLPIKLQQLRFCTCLSGSGGAYEKRNFESLETYRYKKKIDETH